LTFTTPRHGLETTVADDNRLGFGTVCG